MKAKLHSGHYGSRDSLEEREKARLVVEAIGSKDKDKRMYLQ